MSYELDKHNESHYVYGMPSKEDRLPSSAFNVVGRTRVRTFNLEEDVDMKLRLHASKSGTSVASLLRHIVVGFLRSAEEEHHV